MAKARRGKKPSKTQNVSAPPQSFEALALYIADACAQLVKDMQAQQANYLVPADNVVRLIERTADASGLSEWQVWEAWALRHAIPVRDLVRKWAHDRDVVLVLHDDADVQVMQKRLRDLLGYCVLGLVMCDRELSYTKRRKEG